MNISTISQAILKGSLREGAGAVGDWGRARYNKACQNFQVAQAPSVAQTAVATIGTSALLADVNWIAVASASALAGILSLLTSLAGLPECKEDEAAEENKAE